MEKKKHETIEEGLAYAKRFCGAKESYRKEVREKLIKYGQSVENADKIVETLLKEDYINEQRYADLYARSKIRQSHWGMIKIKRMLLFKGIAVEYINSAFAKVDKQEYKQILENLFYKKLSSIKVEDEYQKKYRLQYFLSSHGFENDLIEELFRDNAM